MSSFIKRYYGVRPVYAEAFAGGFGLGIQLLLNEDVEHVLINDLDPCIYSFWKAILTPRCHQRFVRMLREVTIDLDTWHMQKEIFKHHYNYSVVQVGFATFFLNRCNRSGILMANPIGGIHQDGTYKMDCRFNKPRLEELIGLLYSYRNRITVSNEDAVDFMRSADRSYNNLLFNFDPPYVNAGPFLYKNNYDKEDHIALSKEIQKLKNRWILTYDTDRLIKKHYQSQIIRPYRFRYSLEQKRAATELIVYDRRFKDPPKLIL